jgi:hypothetical protein
MARQSKDVVRQGNDGSDEVGRIWADRQGPDKGNVARRNARRSLLQRSQARESAQSAEFGRVDGGEKLQNTERRDRILDDRELEKEVGYYAVEYVENLFLCQYAEFECCAWLSYIAGDAANAIAAGNSKVLGNGADEEG